MRHGDLRCTKIWSRIESFDPGSSRRPLRHQQPLAEVGNNETLANSDCACARLCRTWTRRIPLRCSGGSVALRVFPRWSTAISRSPGLRAAHAGLECFVAEERMDPE